MNPKDRDAIQKLEKRLDSRSKPQAYRDVRAEFTHPEVESNPVWAPGESLASLADASRAEREQKHSKIFKKILLGSLGFFVLALSIAAFLFFRGSNMVSANNIDITVSAPTSISGGEELSLEIEIANRNSAKLEGVNLLVEYPEGTRVAGNLDEELLRQREPLGDINSRDTTQKTVKAVLFGEKDTVKTITITLEYRIEGSSAVFSKEKNYDIGIRSAPIIVTPQYPSEVDSNQEFEFVLDIASNTGEQLENVIIIADYPFGFTATDSDPAPYSSDNVWRLGELATGERRTITIRGTLQGQNAEERTFRFEAGIASPQNEREIGATLTALAETITIKRSQIGLDVKLAGSAGAEYVAELGERIPVTIVWKNNLSTRVLNGRIEARLSGNVLDRSSIVAGAGGFYRSSDNTIVWDRNTNPAFSDIEPGEEGAVSFTFSPLASVPSSARNQGIALTIGFTGSQLSSDNTPQALSTSVNRSVKLGSEFGLTTRLLRTIGPFENSGPMPPRAEEETTYTVVWTLTNSLNDVSNARITASLPQYVKWNGLSSPGGAVTFDPVTNTVTWNAGTVRGGTGFSTAPHEASFQVTLLPSLGQVGTVPVVVGQTSVRAEDSFTGAILQFVRSALNTRLSSDPSFREEQATVVE
jgi:hypothetical protein